MGRGPNYNVIDGDWRQLSIIISDLSSRIINEDTSFTDYILADGSRVYTSTGLGFKDEDNMASDSAVATASQQSIKKYVDDEIVGAVEQGTAQGQLLFWYNVGSQWNHTETSELFWNDTTKRLGIGVNDPDELVELFNAGTQLKLSYDGTNYITFTTQSDGDLTLDSNKTSYTLNLGDGFILTTGVIQAGRLTDGTLNIQSGSITSAVNGTFSGTVQAGQLTSTGGITAESLVIDSTTLVVNAASYEDRVGIGTATPGYILDIDAGEIGEGNYNGLRIVDTGWKATSHPMLEFYNSNAQFGGGRPLARIYGEIGSIGENSKLYFAVADSSMNLQDRMVIDKGGNVGIGVTTVDANYKLIIRRAANINLGIGLQETELAIAAFNDVLSANIPMRFYAAEYNLLNGNVGINVTDPDAKLEVVGTLHISDAATFDSTLGAGAITGTSLTIDTSSATALLIEDDGTYDNVLLVDTTRPSVGINLSSWITARTVFQVEGLAGAIPAQSGQDMKLMSGGGYAATNPDSSGAGGVLRLNAGDGGALIGAGTAGTGGIYGMTAGDGGAVTLSAAEAGSGGIGGIFELESGDGGTPAGSTSGASVGGDGGLFKIDTGAGAWSTPSSTSNTAGDGGDFVLTTGGGGLGGVGGTGGDGGDIVFDTGEGGFGVDTSGIAGEIIFKIGGTAVVKIDKDGNTLIGDGGATNYTSISATGVQTFAGTARVKKHLQGIVISGRGANSPTARITEAPYLSWTFAVNDDTHETQIIPKDMDVTASADIIVSWYTTDATADGVDSVNWQAQWSSEAVGELVTAGSTTDSSGDVLCGAQYAIIDTIVETIPANSIAQDDHLGLDITRIALTAGTNPSPTATSVHLISIEIEYTIDKLGKAL